MRMTDGMFQRGRARRPPHRHHQRELADQRAGTRDHLGAGAVVDAEGAALHDKSGIGLLALLEQHGRRAHTSRCSEPIASMRSDSRPNKRKVGTRSSKATSSSMDIRGDRDEPN